MDWPSVILTLLVLLVIQQLKYWWFSDAHHLEQASLEGANRAGVGAGEATQSRDGTGPKPAVRSADESILPLGAPLADPPLDVQDVKSKRESTVATTARPERNETANLQGHTSVLPSATGLLSYSHDFVLNQQFMFTNETKEKVLRWLAKYTMPGAEFDARGHAPSCHPGTRITILKESYNWIDDPQRAHRVLWLHGPAGVGKSAIIQSLAERLAKASKLGASLFFSRPNNRDDPSLVFPTIAYQLAVRIPHYKEYLWQKMVEDPKLLEKDMAQQFHIFIVEPFTNPSFIAECGMWAILLDGLDECNDEEAQVLIITLISSLSLQCPGLPLVWFIASRPEAHLKHAFASEGIEGSFVERDVPANSNEGCHDVEKFLRAKFEEIRQKYKDLIPTGAPWPVEQDITRISGTSLGLFALAATVARYIEDPHVCDPISQLSTVVSVTSGLEPGSLSTLHTFYSAILGGVPKSMTPIVRLLLQYYTTYAPPTINPNQYSIPLVYVATLFDLQQHTVYGALRRLHSVIKVPPPEDSGRLGIEFHHASFYEYLVVASGEYKRDHKELALKMWWGYFKMLHEGDSSSYQRAISGGRLSIPLSWDAHLLGVFVEVTWENGISHLFPTPILQPDVVGLDQTRMAFTETELYNFLEKVDFGALILRKRHSYLYKLLFDFFDWLVDETPPDLVQSNLIKIVPLRDLNLNSIPRERLAHEFTWESQKQERLSKFEGPRKLRFSRDAVHPSSHHYANASESLHSDWHNETRPLEDLITKLGQLQSADPTTQALIVGRGPSRCCVLISVEPQVGEQGIFFYVPYGQ